ncbi:MAG: SpoIID/LytB domain-containing protein [Actinomycetota bacterium]
MRGPVLLVAALAAAAPVPASASAAAVPVVVIEGRGHGHGVGMAQDGAYWMGRAGSTTAQILSQFYPGTTIGRAGGEVRVTVHTGGTVLLGFPGGGEVRDGRDGAQSAGFPVRVGAGGHARVRLDGSQYTVEVVGGQVAAPAPPPAGPAPAGGSLAAAAQDPATTTTAAAPSTTTTTTRPGSLHLLPDPGGPLLPLPSTPLKPLPQVTVSTTTTAPPATAPAAQPRRAASARALWAVPNGGNTVAVPERGHRYRGVLQLTGTGPLRVVNHVDVEQYLRGMGEVRNPSWPMASLRAQAVAARTYAMRAMAGGGELCDSQQCQVYLGAEAEYGAMDKAVASTRGQVLMFRRSLAAAVYSANGGGFSASTEEGFGTPGAGYPYLRPARYPTSDVRQWTVTVSVRDLAARLGYRGRVSAVRTKASGPSGRAVEVTIEGSAGPRTVTGIGFDRALGLKSTFFTVKLGESATAPPPPPPADEAPLQGLPGPADPALDASPTADGATPVAAAGASAPLAGGAGASIGGRAGRPVALAALAWLLLAGVGAGLAAVRVGAGSPRPPAGRRRRAAGPTDPTDPTDPGSTPA